MDPAKVVTAYGGSRSGSVEYSKTTAVGLSFGSTVALSRAEVGPRSLAVSVTTTGRSYSTKPVPRFRVVPVVVETQRK